MSNATYYVQSCPTCGRSLRIRVEYLGKSLICQHCRGSLTAVQSDGVPLRPLSRSSRGDTLLERADALLRQSEHAPG